MVGSFSIERKMRARLPLASRNISRYWKLSTMLVETWEQQQSRLTTPALQDNGLPDQEMHVNNMTSIDRSASNRYRPPKAQNENETA